MEGIDVINSSKPDLEQKRILLPQKPKNDHKSIGKCVRTYVFMYTAFRNNKSQSYEIRNLSSIVSSMYSKFLVEIGTQEVDIYIKDFLVFEIFSKTALTFSSFNPYDYIKCHKVLDVYKFQSD